MAGTLFDMVETANNLLNIAVTGITVAALFLCIFLYSITSIKNQGLSQGINLSFVFLLEIIIIAGLFWELPILLSKIIRYSGVILFTRWLLLSGIVITHFYFRKHSEKRGLTSAFLHLTVLILGWYINRWIGILIFSLPLLFIFYYAAYCIALVIIPTSNPEDRKEKHQRYMTFLSYVWGMQMPLWNVSTVNAKEAEKRIDGKPIANPFSSQQSSSQLRGNKNIIRNTAGLFPGMIRTDTHQVVGILNGKDFRVEGPGVIFTKSGDEPFEVVDLRVQSRRSTITAFSKEGIPFQADLVVIFAIDREDWNLGLFHQLRRANTLLIKGKDIDRNRGLRFPYSQARVEAAIRLRSKSSQPNPNKDTERWDDHVVSMAEQAGRQTFAGRSIKDLWQARENENSNVSEAITVDIKKLIENPLRENGIRLIRVNTSEFKFSGKKRADGKEDEVIEQQINTWMVEQNRDLDMALVDAKAKADRIEQDARVYAQSVLLTAIVEGLEQARKHHQSQDHEAIAQVYLDALKKLIEQHTNINYKSEALSELQKYRDYYNSKS